MKFKTTARDIRNGYCNIISVGYCNVQRMTRNRSPIAYTCGVYGWNFDVYDVSDIHPSTVICTGYRGMPAGVKIDYAKMIEHEKAAYAGDPETELKAWIKEVMS